METVQQVLSTLRDVAGIRGSFLVSSEGRVVARDLPIMFSDEVLGEVAPRIVRLTDGIATEGGEVRSCVLRFAEHTLFLRAVPRGAICVLTSPDVNMPALKMGVNLASRRVTSILETATPVYGEPSSPPPLPPSARTSASVPVQPPEPPPRPALQWRGSTVPR